MAQTDYSNPASGQAGDLAYAGGNDNLVLTYNVVTGGLIMPGLGVAKISGDDNGIKLPDASNSVLVGVATRDTSEENTEDSTFTYAATSNVGVVRRGVVWVLVDQDVTPDDAVYVRFNGEVEVFTITWNADFVASNSIAGNINGEALTATVFSVSHDATIAALATKIQALTSVATATCPGSGSRVITVTGATKGEDLSTNSSFTVTLGASQATDTIANVTGPSTGTQAGVFRKDDDDVGSGALAVAKANCKFLTNGSAGGIALLDLNIA